MKKNDDNLMTAEVREAVCAIKAAILKSQAQAAQMVNHEQLSLYYGIGRYVSEHSRKGFWGTGAIENISRQLKSELPGLKGFSAENIKLMRRFYEAWKEIVVNLVNESTEMQLTCPPNSVDGTTELQVAGSEPIHQLQLTAYLRVLDDEEKLPDENPSVGIILCKKADKAYVEYVLQDYLKPMGVATYKQMQERLRELLPPEKEMKRLISE